VAAQTVWEVFEEERPRLVAYRGRFDGFHALPVSVSKTCLVRFDNNKYSVNASAVGRPVELHTYADRIVVRQYGRIVAEYRRSYGRPPAAHLQIEAGSPQATIQGANFRRQSPGSEGQNCTPEHTPLLDAFSAWAEAMVTRLSAKSALAVAFRYCESEAAPNSPGVARLVAST
jgi:hypothetical protein